ncbi:MAG: fused MFS/spermidine synthase [Planctomycetes bacterium]|nr:fused MFS/spermidine synthase [Planctomycetota bacterium]
MLVHAATILIAAFLLFIVQPLIGRYILPWYGGTPAVWTVALLFFQAALLAGYGYAHLLGKLKPRLQPVVHGLFVLAGLAFLPIIPDASFRPAGGDPALEILWLLARTIGVPFVALAATSPLLQAWLAGAQQSPRIYRLYALSNVGSLVALLAYPFVLEPWVGRDAQAWAWSVGYGAFALATLLAGVRRARSAPPVAAASEVAEPAAVAHRVLWFALGACGVWLLMAVTNEMSINIAPTPFLWVLPLGLYLLSFIVAFGSERATKRKLMLPALLGSFVLFPVAASSVGHIPIALRVGMFAVALFLACLCVHGELYRLRPHASRLTGYYLSIAGGGAAGGAFVGVIVPHVFPMYWEFEIGQMLSMLAVLGALAVDKSSRLYRFRPRWGWVVILLMLLAWGDQQATTLRRELRDTLDSRRSFFGVSRVSEKDGLRTLVHGTVRHGEQFQDERRSLATTYFSPTSGIGQTLNGLPGRKRVGVVGLGIGTLVAYGNAGDVFRFYELDPDVEQLARAHFSYLRDCPAEVQVTIGDGRLLLEGEDAQAYDVLALDAFSSDAVPVHLLTLEAFDAYRRHLAPGGVIAVNITNHNLDLMPVIVAAARAKGWHWKRVISLEDETTGALEAHWMLLAPTEAGVARLPEGELDPDARELPPWTDDFSNLFRILK